MVRTRGISDALCLGSVYLQKNSLFGSLHEVWMIPSRLVFSLEEAMDIERLELLYKIKAANAKHVMDDRLHWDFYCSSHPDCALQ